MIFLASSTEVQVLFGLGESINIFDILRHIRGAKMSSIPMGVHAAFKVRDHLNGNNGSQPGSEKEKFGFGFNSFQAKAMSGTEMQFNQPAQYNGKLMNAVWGMYNAMSTHNIKSHIAFDQKA